MGRDLKMSRRMELCQEGIKSAVAERRKKEKVVQDEVGEASTPEVLIFILEALGEILKGCRGAQDQTCDFKGLHQLKC